MKTVRHIITPVRLWILIGAVLFVSIGFWLWLGTTHSSNSAAPSSVGCTQHEQSEVIIIAYRTGISERQLHAMASSVSGTVQDVYNNLQTASISVPAHSSKAAIYTLRTSALVASAHASPSEECIDSD